jgi:hypothetical protein
MNITNKGQEMFPMLYTEHASASRRSTRDTQDVAWSGQLPSAWKDLVVAPISFDIFQEFEIVADRTLGYDEDHRACYCAARYVLSELRSDDDDVFYEEPVYVESLLAWRLRDERWLIFRKVIGNYGLGAAHSFFSFSDSLPR